MTIATQAAQSTSANSTSSTSSSSSTNALTQLSGNFQDFLQMLMTQLQNQDPTSPMDTNQFTSELVQFSNVEQQIQTNSSLTQLIQLTQGDAVLQSASLVGKPVQAQSTTLPLQNGTGELSFTGTAGQKVLVSIADTSGTVVKAAAMTAQQGTNIWQWDGTNMAGNTLPDGAYTASVTTADSSGNATPVTFTVLGTATGVQVNNGTVSVQMGAASVPLSSVQSVGGSGS